MVTGTPRHSESNGGIERLNRCVNASISAWLAEHASAAEHQRWALALPFVQFQLNLRFHRGIKAVLRGRSREGACIGGGSEALAIPALGVCVGTSKGTYDDSDVL